MMKPDSRLVEALHPSPNVGVRRDGCRPRLILFHYTGMESAAKAIDWLARPESNVSCHYVIDDTGLITQMVPEAARAWHAGASHWAGETDINSVSIGIEIQNPGHAQGYPDFPNEQMLSVAALSRDIAARHAIRPESMLAHSDVSPGRKIDPGEKFDWAWLAHVGVGHWTEPVTVDAIEAGCGVEDEGAHIAEAQTLLRQYGYGVETHGRLDEKTQIVLRAFQLHFRPARIDGLLDTSTRDTLKRLIAALPVTVAG
ncbi:MAG: N-acetylmuramoyl-L-alanine amidase [Hyphomicrobium sp.]